MHTLNVVLVRTIYDSNVGASARAMSNMGAHRLILIDPQFEEISLKAHQAAANGQEPLENRTVYPTWDDFYQHESEGLRISLTARNGKVRHVKDLEESLQWVFSNHPSFLPANESKEPIYLIFGPEDKGLSTEDLGLSHYVCSIPTFGANTSLNLAQAVLVALFVFQTNLQKKLDVEQKSASATDADGDLDELTQDQPSDLAPQTQVFPEQTLRTWLEELGYNLSHRKVNVYLVLKRMLLQNIPSNKEYRILETVLQQNIRKRRCCT